MRSLLSPTLQHQSPPNALLSGRAPLILPICASPPPINLHRPFPYRPINLPPILAVRCAATGPGTPPPPPPESDSPGGGDGKPPTGLAPNFSISQDSARIFFAVFFWLSLFFWVSAWDGRSNGRPNKGSHFRR